MKTSSQTAKGSPKKKDHNHRDAASSLGPRGITGRDGYILSQALAYAIAAIERLPRERQEFGNQRDMKALLDYMVDPHQQASLFSGVHKHLTGEGHPSSSS